MADAPTVQSVLDGWYVQSATEIMCNKLCHFHVCVWLVCVDRDLLDVNSRIGVYQYEGERERL